MSAYDKIDSGIEELIPSMETLESTRDREKYGRTIDENKLKMERLHRDLLAGRNGLSTEEFRKLEYILDSLDRLYLHFDYVTAIKKCLEEREKNESAKI